MCSILEGFAYLRFLQGFPTAEYTPSEFRKNKGRLSFLLHLYFVHQTLLIPLNIRLRPPRVTPKAQTITSNQQSTSSVGFRQDDRDHNLKSTSSVGFRQDDRDHDLKSTSSVGFRQDDRDHDSILKNNIKRRLPTG